MSLLHPSQHDKLNETLSIQFPSTIYRAATPLSATQRQVDYYYYYYYVCVCRTHASRSKCILKYFGSESNVIHSIYIQTAQLVSASFICFTHSHTTHNTTDTQGKQNHFPTLGTHTLAPSEANPNTHKLFLYFVIYVGTSSVQNLISVFLASFRALSVVLPAFRVCASISTPKIVLITWNNTILHTSHTHTRTLSSSAHTKHQNTK